MASHVFYSWFCEFIDIKFSYASYNIDTGTGPAGPAMARSFSAKVDHFCAVSFPD